MRFPTPPASRLPRSAARPRSAAQSSPDSRPLLELVPSSDRRSAVAAQPRAPAAHDPADPAHRHAESLGQVSFGSFLAEREEQLVVFAAAKRELEVAARDRAIGRRQRNRPGVDFGADAASFEQMAKVLPKPVADIDRGRSGTNPRETHPRRDSRNRIEVAIDEESARRAARFDLT